MNYKFEIEQLNASSAIEGGFTLLSSAGLPAYLGWHGDSIAAFLVYAVAAGLAITTGLIILHPTVRPTEPTGVLVTWGLQTSIVGMIGGIAFGLAATLR